MQGTLTRLAESWRPAAGEEQSSSAATAVGVGEPPRRRPRRAEAAAAAAAVHWSPEQFHWDPSSLTARPVVDFQGGSDETQASAGTAGQGPAAAAEVLPVWPDPPAEADSDGAGRKPPPSCQVCAADVSGLKDYYKRYRICPDHCIIPCIVKAGVHLRFCQQCGRFQALEDFDDTKRTCRRKLERHNERRRQLALAKNGGKVARKVGSAPATKAGGGAAAAAAPAASGGGRCRQKRAARAPGETGAVDKAIKIEAGAEVVKLEAGAGLGAVKIEAGAGAEAGELAAAEVGKAEQQPMAGTGASADTSSAGSSPHQKGLDAGSARADALAAAGLDLPADVANALLAPVPAGGQQGAGLADMDVDVCLSLSPGSLMDSLSACPHLMISPLPGMSGGFDANLMLASPTMLPGLPSLHSGADSSPLQPLSLQRVQPAAHVAGVHPAQQQQQQQQGGLHGSSSARFDLQGVSAHQPVSAPAQPALTPGVWPQQQQWWPPPPLPPQQQQQQPQPQPQPQPQQQRPLPAPWAAQKAQPQQGSRAAHPAATYQPTFGLPPPLGHPTGASAAAGIPAGTAPAASHDFDALLADLFAGGVAPGSPYWLVDLLLPLPPGPPQPGAGLGMVQQHGVPPAQMQAQLPSHVRPEALSLHELVALREVQLQQLAAAQPSPQPPAPASLQQALDMIQRQSGEGQQAQQAQQQWQQHEARAEQGQETAVRLSIKAFGATPDQLPASMRQDVQALLDAPHLQGYLRPGCLHLTLQALLRDQEQLGELRSLGVAGAVERLAQDHSGLGRLLRQAPALVQLDGQVAVVAQGRVVRVLQLSDCSGVLPTITSLSPIALHTGCPARVLVRGRNLAGLQARLLVRSHAEGRYPLVEILSTSGASSPAPTGGQAALAASAPLFADGLEEWMEIRLPDVTQGLYSVEAQRGALLGSSSPLLALDSAPAVAEICQLAAYAPAGAMPGSGQGGTDALLRSIGLVVHYQQAQQAQRAQQADGSANGGISSEAAGCAAHGPDCNCSPVAAASSTDLHGPAADGNGTNGTAAAAQQAAGLQEAALAALAARAAREGVAAAAYHGWPALAELLLPTVTADSSSAEHAVRAMDSACPPDSSLLLVATASGNAPLLQVLAAWGRQQGHTWAVVAPSGPLALTPLHVGAATRSLLVMKALHGMDPAGTELGLRSAKTTDGLSPAAFALLLSEQQQLPAPQQQQGQQGFSQDGQLPALATPRGLSGSAVMEAVAAAPAGEVGKEDEEQEEDEEGAEEDQEEEDEEVSEEDQEEEDELEYGDEEEGPLGREDREQDHGLEDGSHEAEELEQQHEQGSGKASWGSPGPRSVLLNPAHSFSSGSNMSEEIEAAASAALLQNVTYGSITVSGQVTVVGSGSCSSRPPSVACPATPQASRDRWQSTAHDAQPGHAAVAAGLGVAAPRCVPRRLAAGAVKALRECMEALHL